MIEKNCVRKAGAMALWLGNFKNPEDFYKYIQSFYCIFEGEEEEYNPEYNFLEKDFNKELEKIFSAKKEWKKEFEEMFEECECFNRFEYDFGVTFDEDFQVCGNSKEPTDDLKILFKDWKDLIKPVKNFLGKNSFNKKYNCFFGIPSCRYNGIIEKISNEFGELEFLGNIEENIFSNELAEEYNF